MADPRVTFVDVAFGGVDSKTNEPHVSPPKSLMLENASMSEDQALLPRDAYESLGTASVRLDSAGTAFDESVAVTAGLLIGDNDRLYHLYGGALYDYQDALNQWWQLDWASHPVTSVKQVNRSVEDVILKVDGVVHDSGFAAVGGSVALGSTFRIFVTHVDTGVLHLVTEVTGNYPRFARSGNYLVCFYVDASADLQAMTLDTTDVAGGWSSPTTMFTGTVSNVDVCDLVSGHIFVAFADGAPAVELVDVSISGAGVPSAGTPTAVSFDVGACVAVGANGSRVAVTWGYAAGTTQKIRLYNDSLTALGAALSFDSTRNGDVCSVCVHQISSSYKARVVYSEFGTPLSDSVTYTATIDVATIALEEGVQDYPGVVLEHKGFVVNPATTPERGWYFGAFRDQTDDTANHTFFEPAAGDDRYAALVARYRHLTAYGASVNAPSSVTVRSTETSKYYWFGVSLDGHVDDLNSVSWYSLEMYTIDFSSDVIATAEKTTALLACPIAGSASKLVSRETVDPFEGGHEGLLDFVTPHRPEAPAIVEGAGGSLDATAEYHYRFTHEWRDARGRLHQSVPSEDVSVTLTGGNQSTVITFATPGPLPRKAIAGYIVVWRSEGNPTSPILYYRMGHQDWRSYGAGNTFGDGQADTQITDKQVLYTVSGELENFPPPPSRALALWKDRLLALDSETGNVWCSKTLLQGEVPGFHPSLAFSTAVNASSLPKFMSTFDDRILLWWSDAIGVMSGDPPTDTGQPGTLSEPDLLPQRGIGLKYVKSLVMTPLGAMFMSNRGFYLLDGGLQLSYIGRDVEAYNDQVVTGAVMAEARQRNEVRFSLDTGETLVYDILSQQWHVHTLSGNSLDQPILSAALYDGEHAMAVSGKYVWRSKSSGNDPDGGAPGSLTVWRSGWIKVADSVLGELRAHEFYLYASFVSGGGTIALRYNYSSTIAETGTPTNTSLAPLRVQFHQQACFAISIEVSGFTELSAVRLQAQSDKGALLQTMTAVAVAAPS